MYGILFLIENKIMMKRILFICLYVFCLSAYCQEQKEYIVYIFSKTWDMKLSKISKGPYMWIIPYDSCRNEMNVKDLKPFFATEEMKESLEWEKDNGFGEISTDLWDKTDSVACFFRKNKRLIQRTKTKSYFHNYNITLSVELVPIKAICRNDLLGFHKKEIVVLDDSLQLWSEFWKEDEYIYRKLISEDYLSFDFIVRLSNRPFIP